MATKHTPGPWHYEHIGQDGWGISSNNLEGIAIVPHSLNMTHDEANARLIAAAPDLLQALEAIAPILSIDDGDVYEITYKRADLRPLSIMARAAIAKATQKGE